MASTRSMARNTQPQEPSALDRLKLLERRFRNVVQQTEAVLNDLNRRIGDVTSALNAVVQIIGVDAVQAKAKENYIAAQEAKADEEEELVKGQLDAGLLVSVDYIDPSKPGTLIVTSEVGADGVQKYPTRNFVPYAAFSNGIQDLLKGAKVGDTITFPEISEGDTVPEGYEAGTKLTLIALYEVAPPKAEVTKASSESADVPAVEGSSETAQS